MSKTFVLINENFVPAAEASILINDLAIQRGYGIFDFLKLIDGKPVFLDDHLERFYNSASQMRLNVEQNPEALKTLLFSLIERNKLDAPYTGIRMTLTGGYSNDGFSLSKPNLIIAQQAYSSTREAANKGTSLVSYSHQRQFAHVKTIDYLMAIWLKPYIGENGADDVLYHQNGFVSECPRSNFFIVSSEGKLLTPGKNILKGIIRKQLLSLNATSSYRVEEGDISLEEVYNAREVFITSSTKNIQPVIMVDGRLISNGQPGEITKSLQAQLSQMIFQHVHSSQF